MSSAQTPPSNRRRRRRTPTAASERPPEPPADPPRPRPARADPGERAERGLRELAGGGKSQVGVDGALRARDVDRPSAADLAEAEATVKIVRRNWTPPST